MRRCLSRLTLQNLLGREPRNGMDFYFGQPEDVATRVRRHVRDAPVETVYFWASIDGMPEDMVVRNVQVLATRLRQLLAYPAAWNPV